MGHHQSIYISWFMHAGVFVPLFMYRWVYAPEQFLELDGVVDFIFYGFMYGYVPWMFFMVSLAIARWFIPQLYQLEVLMEYMFYGSMEKRPSYTFFTYIVDWIKYFFLHAFGTLIGLLMGSFGYLCYEVCFFWVLVVLRFNIYQGKFILSELCEGLENL